MKVGAIRLRKTKRAMGRSPTTRPDMRCCAVSVRISPWMRTRSRMVKAMESRISARLPPTWCWMEIAMTISSRSSERTRRTMLSSAWSKGRPRLTSRTTRANSVDMGAWVSRTTISIACRNEAPARRALATSVIVSASWSLNFLSREFWRRRTQKRGRKKPTIAPTTRKSGLPSVGRMGDSRSMSTGTPTVVAAHRPRYSLTRSLRSARARSDAIWLPKSCRSSLRLIARSAGLAESAWAQDWASPSGFACSWPDDT